VRFVEHEHQLRLVEVADFREVLEQFRQQPQQETGVQLGLQDQLVGGEDVDHAAAVGGRAHEVTELQRRLAEEHVGAFLLQAQQGALDRADRRRADQAIRGTDVLALVGDQAEQRAQVVEVEQQQAAVVGQLEHDVEHAGLGFVQLQDAREQGGADLADGGAYRMAQLAPEIPEHHRRGLVAVIADAHQVDALLQLLARRARHRQPGHVALHVGQEDRHADPAEALGQGHQGDRLAGTGRAGDQAVAVAVLRQQEDIATGLGGDGLAYEDRIHACSCADVAGDVSVART